MNNIKNMKTQIKAEIVADSLSPQGDRLISLLITFPRIILAEVNTHRMLSKNTSSSRAIPFKKMVESVENDPFIPIAWQKNHSGMQGNEYLSKTKKYNLVEFITSMTSMLHAMIEGTEEHDKLAKELDEKIEIIEMSLMQYTTMSKTLDEWWLLARDKAVEAASIMYVFGVTKQLCNRLLEPFMWTTMLITGSKEGWDNFFNLRCPIYKIKSTNIDGEETDIQFKSRKDFINYVEKYDDEQGSGNEQIITELKNYTDLEWLQINEGQAEIHIMDLAEKIYDAMNESKPTLLKSGEWHIPFGENINNDGGKFVKFMMDYAKNRQLQIYPEGTGEVEMTKVKVSTAMAARTSYTVVGDEKEIDYQKQLELHDRLISQDPPHSSPMEHCARAMSNKEYYSFIKGEIPIIVQNSGEIVNRELYPQSYSKNLGTNFYGWCRNFKGFIQYRYLIENGDNIK